MALYHAIRKHRLPSNPSLIHLFSTSSSDPPPQDDNTPVPNASRSQSSSSPSQFSFASSLSDVKASLKQNSQPQQHDGRRPFASFDPQTQNPTSSFSGNPSGRSSTSILEIKKNLAEFRRRSTIPQSGDSGSTPASQSQPHISFQELYQRNAASNSTGSSTDPGARKFGDMNLSAIRESLKQLRSRENTGNSTEKTGQSFSGFRNLTNMKPDENVRSNVVEGTQTFPLPISVFGKEMDERKEKKGKEGATEEMRAELVKSYSADELGEKLRLLRQSGKKEEGWFSLQELNERLIKLREWEEQQATTKTSGVKTLSFYVKKLKEEEVEKKRASLDRLDTLMQFGTPSFMRHPPKEHLIDNYIHPDNMSSAEKMKKELAKAREKFKQSESDCGSSIVQVAQLTIKIKHLSSVLHKKDKHSRKGLIAMVQRRKKILKYMRRKEWDSYCIALSELGLRDNPDYKQQT